MCIEDGVPHINNKLKEDFKMKKIISILIAAMMLCTAFTGVCAEDGIKVTVNGNELVFDVPPQMINNRTMVPMRAIFEALGAEVEWDGELRHIIAETQNKHIDMFVGVDTMNVTKNGDTFAEMIKLDVPPQIIDSRTLVPIRAVSEALDCEVDWNGEKQIVDITSNHIGTLPVSTDNIPIVYDDTAEREAHYMRDFEILTCEKNSEGKYDITFRLRTFLEGRGAVSVTMNCLNEEGSIVDTFGGMYVGTDYTWSWQEDRAAISGDTAKIILSLN